MGQLELLPRELVFLILEHCSFEDCKNLRATCKHLSGIASTRVFQTYRIAFFQSHLERFVELSKNADIASCIKHFVFVGDVLPRIDSIDTFEDLIDMREPWSSFSKKFIEDRVREDPARMNSRDYSDTEYEYRMRMLGIRQDLRQVASSEYENMPKHHLSVAEVQDHYEKYKAYRQQQHDWDPDNQFREAFSRLPNLTSAGNAKHGFADNHLHFPWNRIQKDIIISPNNWMQLHAVEVDDDEVQVIDLLRLPIHMKHVDCLLAAIGHRATLTHGTPLRSLKLVNIGGQPFLHLSEYYVVGYDTDSDDSSSDGSLEVVDVDIDPKTISAKFQGLAHLTNLELDVSYCIPPQSPTAAAQSWETRQLFKEIHAILSATSSLQALKLNCRDDEGDWALEERPMDPEDDTVRRLEIPTLPELESLQLSCTATEESLIGLLRAHSKTLRSIELVDCDLNKGTWTSVLRQMPRILSLKHVYLEGLHDEDYPPESGEEALFEDGLNLSENAHPHDRAIRRFLLYGGEMPELDFNQWYERNRELADQEMLAGAEELLDSDESLD